jgi:hypothetical protein
MPKSWIYEPTLSAYEAMVFYNTMIRRNDPYHYIPIAVAKREEFGMKYRYICLAYDRFKPDQDSLFACIEIYKPTAGKPYATRLHRLSQDDLR